MMEASVVDVFFAEPQARLVGAANSGELRIAGYTDLSRFRCSGAQFLEKLQSWWGRPGSPGFVACDVGIEEIDTIHV